MAKKVKRKVSTVEPNAGSTATPVDSPVSSSMRSVNRRTMTAEEFNPDYSYVVKDLKRIGTLAGIFFVVLIALSFIIR